MTHMPFACRLAIAALFALPAHAAVRLPAVLSDHMVLQRAADVPVWGWASAQETVNVQFGAQKKHVRAGSDGRWKVELDLRKAPAGAAVLTVRGKDNEIAVKDVLVGEVWLASGQSNMQKPIGERAGEKPTFNADAEIAGADSPEIRMFKVAKKKANQPLDDVPGEWVICSPATIDKIKFSAAAYFFGQRLNKVLGAPVGLIDSSWGGTRIDPWTPFPDGQKPAGADKDAGQIFNAMVSGFAPFAIKGVIWYQGESNIMEHEDMAQYTGKMEALVYGWRRHWQRDFAFHYVQVAPHWYHTIRRNNVLSADLAPRLWEAQADALRIPDTGMIVTTDLVDDLADIHPRDKKSIGLRLANVALSSTYKVQGIAAHGPVYRSLAVQGADAVLTFDHAEGLAARDGKPLNWFDIAGADGRYYPGKAEIRDGKVVVTSPHVATPAAVRFGWDEAAQPNLVNQAGLPARPFRTQR